MPPVFWNFPGKARRVPAFTGRQLRVCMVLWWQSFILAQPLQQHHSSYSFQDQYYYPVAALLITPEVDTLTGSCSNSNWESTLQHPLTSNTVSATTPPLVYPTHPQGAVCLHIHPSAGAAPRAPARHRAGQDHSHYSTVSWRSQTWQHITQGHFPFEG